MAQEQRAPRPDAHAIVIRGADDQLAALERLWAAGEAGDPQADEEAWRILRQALNASRRAEEAPSSGDPDPSSRDDEPDDADDYAEGNRDPDSSGDTLDAGDADN